MNKELAIKLLRGSVLGTNEQVHEAVFMAIKALKAEPRHGRWIEDEYGFLVCSECGNTAEYLPILGQIETPYCSECGARMDEVDNG